MKKGKRNKLHSNLAEIDLIISRLKKSCNVILDQKSKIHFHIIINGDFTNVWPTTGSWHHPRSGTTGKGMGSLSAFLEQHDKSGSTPKALGPISFGKYKGMPIEDVALIDPEYIQWAALNVEGFKEVLGGMRTKTPKRKNSIKLYTGSARSGYPKPAQKKFTSRSVRPDNIPTSYLSDSLDNTPPW